MDQLQENIPGTAPQKKIWHAGTLTYTTAGVVLLFFWLLWGDFAWSMKERTVGQVATLLVKSFQIPDLWVSILIVSIPNFTNIFLMPIVSFRSDRHRGKYGRRIPYLLLYTPLVVGGLLGLSVTRQLGDWVQNTLGPEVISARTADLIAFSVFWLLLDLGTTMTNALFMALSNDVVPPKLIGRFVAMFRAVSLGCAVLFNFFLMEHAETHVTAIFASLAVLYGFGLILMCTMVKEGEYPPVAEGEKRKGTLENMRTYFRECFALPYYRWVIGAYVVCVLSVLPINTFGLFYVKSLNISLETYGYMQTAGFLFAMITSYWLGALADRFHPIRVGMVTIGGLGLVLFIGGFLVNGPTSFCIVFVTHNLFIMSFNSLMASYGQRLFPRSLYAQFNSAMTMSYSLCMMAMAPMVGYALDTVETYFYPDQPGKQYFLVFVVGGVFAFAGFFMLMMVLRYYKRYGGDQNYEAPL